MDKTGLRVAKVLASHPEAYAVTVLLLDTGVKIPRVQVLSWSASTNTGAADLPEPSAPKGAYGAADTKDRDTYAVVGFVAGTPVVLGFLFPQVCQMLFEDANRKVERHASDWYTTVDGAGNFEAYHPSGTYLRIGTAPEHEDLTGADYDGKWKIDKNVDAEVYVNLTVANGGDQKARLQIAPTGNILLETVGNVTGTIEGTLSLTVEGNTTADLQGNAAITVGGNITSSASAWSHTGNVTVTGTITGTVDVIGGGKSLKTHTHSGVTAGGGVTGAPV
jgi:hypothetical protein